MEVYRGSEGAEMGCVNEVYEAPSPIEGFGIFAARDFRTGDRVVTIEDEVVPPPWPEHGEAGQRLYYDDLSDGRISRPSAVHQSQL